MGTLISPAELPTWVPGRVVSASDGLGWKDVAHRSYAYVGLDVPIPPMDHFTIVRYRSGDTPMDRCIDGQWSRTTCVPGDFSLLTRSEHSHWQWTRDIEVAHVYLSEALMSRVASDVLERSVSEVRLHDVLQAQDPVVTDIADAITAEARQQGIGGALYAEALSIQLVVHLIRKYAEVSFRDQKPAGPICRNHLRRLDEYIETHIEDGVTIEGMAGILGLGVWTFTRHFRASAGCTPYEYVMRRRVERASQMLSAGHRAIKDVAASCGFADQAHLTRVLRMRLGTTPLRLRQGRATKPGATNGNA